MDNNQIQILSYKGADISFDLPEEMINATQMAKCFNKQVHEWLRLPSTKEYLGALETTRKFGSLETRGKSLSLVMTKEGRNGGTWLNRNAALEFARWLSPEFSIWCNNAILDLMSGKTSSVQPTHTKVSTSKARASMILIEGAQRLLRLSDSSVAMMVNKVADSFALPVKVDYVEATDVCFSLTTLLKNHNVEMSSREFNKLLASAGIIEQKTRKSHKGDKHFWALTEKGLNFGENRINPNNDKEIQPMYYEKSFDKLLSAVNRSNHPLC